MIIFSFRAWLEEYVLFSAQDNICYSLITSLFCEKEKRKKNVTMHNIYVKSLSSVEDSLIYIICMYVHVSKYTLKEKITFFLCTYNHINLFLLT